MLFTVALRTRSAYDPAMRAALVPFLWVVATGALVATWWHNIAAFREGTSPLAFFTDGYANHIRSSLTNDLWFVAAAVFAYMLLDGHRVGIRRPWVYIVLSCTVAVSVAFPLYLIARERKLSMGGGPSCPTSSPRV